MSAERIKFFIKRPSSLGPDDPLYGYMFTAWNHAVMRQVDDKTLSVLDLPVPPGMAYDGTG